MSSVQPAAMHISFDIDDTLVCGATVPVERVSFLTRIRYREPLRRGCRGLMQALEQRGCRIWIYTTSGRSAAYLKGWFASLGVRLEGIVNQSRHEEVVGRRGPSKFPPAFNIGLHIDDSEGVAMEARAHGFSVLVVSPSDEQWCERVLTAVDNLRRMQA